MIARKRANPIGALWLMEKFQIEVFQPLPIVSYSTTTSRRSTETDSQTGFKVEFYQERQRPEDTVIAHLQFHLRYEIPHFEFLSRLFSVINEAVLQEWVNSEPTGKYARRAAFLYEFFTEKNLTAPENLAGNYIDAINSKKLVTASKHKIEKNQKWRVNNNLAGNRDFCPILIKTEKLIEAISVDVKTLLDELNNEVGEDTLLRSAGWFTLGESRASFKIEGETDKSTRIQRFADVIERFTGKMELPLDLALLQKEILGTQTAITQFGLRQSPVFIGQIRRFQEIVHYIAPPFQTLQQKLDGLDLFWQKTEGQSPILRSAAIAFAFVYIHPLADGNGRLHRFLFNDLLRRDNATYDPIILPISGVISGNEQEKIAYANILEQVSKLVMHCLSEHYRFSKKEQKYSDGIQSNFEVEHSQLAEPIWQYPDLTQHILYFSELVKKTITVYMRNESYYLNSYEQAKSALTELIEMPNHYVDRIIRSIQENNGKLTNKLAKDYPFLKDEQLWQQMVEVVKEAFQKR